MHPTSIYRLLAACLCALSLSSCYSMVHQHVWQRAKVAENAAWVENRRDIPLYSDGKSVYAQGTLGTARGCYEGTAFKLLLPSYGHPSFRPDKATTTPAYFLVEPYTAQDSSAAEILRMEARGETTCAIRPGRVAELPANAKPLRIRGQYENTLFFPRKDIRFRETPESTKTDAHKYYAYPLGVLTAVAVDAPLTVAMNIPLVCAGVFILPYELCVSLSEVCCSQTAPAPAAKMAEEKNPEKESAVP